MKKLLLIAALTFAIGLSPAIFFGQTLYLDYSTYLGGNSSDYGYGISAGTDGRAYVTGYTGSSNFPTENPYQATHGDGNYDVFVTALSSTGSTIFYSTYLGGSNWDRGYGISVGTDGRAYVTGITDSTDFPTKYPYQAGSGGLRDAFVTSLSSSGSDLSYSTYLGGSDDDYGMGISIGADGIVTVAGYTGSPNFPTENPYQPAYAGSYDVFVTTLSISGTALSYSTYLGGTGVDYGRGISRGADGMAYITGDTSSWNFPTQHPYQASYSGGGGTAFVSTLLSTGSLSYSTYLGGSGADSAREISQGADGRSYVTGTTNSSDFPAENPYQSSSAGNNDVFITSLSSSGSALFYSTYLGGGNNDYGHGISLGSDGRAYVTGYTASSNFPTKKPYQSSSAGNYDAFVSALSPSGSTLSFSSYFGGNSIDYGRSISTEDNGMVYLTGETQSSTDFPIENPYQGNHGGGSVAAFVSKLIFAITPPPTPTLTPAPTSTRSPTPIATRTMTPPPTSTPPSTPSPTPIATRTMTPPPTSTPTPTPARIPWITDYNGDGTSDIAIFRESSGLWAIREITRVYFGAGGDSPQPGDYDGDGTTDIGLYRRTSGLWAMRGVSRIYFGGAADDPIPADYDGDGTTDPGIFRPASGLWAVRGISRAYFGGSTDEPIPGYYSGMGLATVAIFRPSSGLWAFREATRIYFGGFTDDPVPGDFNGSGAWRPGIFRQSSGLWAVAGVTRAYFGSSVDWPVPGEYSGDGTDDIAIYRSSSGLWAVKGITRVYFGGSSDIPVTR